MQGVGNFGKRVLLTGAGFSVNYGGYLAKEFRTRLLAHDKIDSNPHLHQFILTARNGFEVALQQARDNFGADSRIALTLEEAIFELFKEMDERMADHQHLFSSAFNNTRVSIFLQKFAQRSQDVGYIFTLNQDFCFERKFYNHDTCLPPTLPGVKNYNGDFSTHFDQTPFVNRIETIRQNPTNIPIPRQLNVIKLHGACNWRTPDDKRLLIIGGNKADAIHKSPLLAKYHQLFEDVLTSGSVKLFVLGYSFTDPHINEVIDKGAQTGLKLYIMEPVESLDTITERMRNYNAPVSAGKIFGYVDEPFTRVFHKASMIPDRFHPTIEKFFRVE